MTTDEVISFFCAKKGVPPEEIYRRGRNPNRWYTRYMIWHYMHHTMNISTSVISRKFNRNRPSVFRGIRIITEHMKYHRKVRHEYHEYIKELEGMVNTTPSEDMEEK